MKKYVKPTMLVVELNTNMHVLVSSGADVVNNSYEENLEQMSRKEGFSLWDDAEEDY